MYEAIPHQQLKTKQREIRSGFPETVGLRIHRSISWVGRAETEDVDLDAKFLFLWIAFNAAYAKEEDQGIMATGERGRFNEFFSTLVAHDVDQKIYDAIWHRFSGPVRNLMQNKFVFNPFWQFHNGVDEYVDWEIRLSSSAHSFAKAFQEAETPRVLSFVFDRLYVLRNQIMHGGSTWNSGVNRTQVADGSEILSFLMPIFLDIMMDNPESDWGRPFYPVVD